MPIDELEFDALKKQLEMEGLSVSPIAKLIVGVAGVIPLPPPFTKAIQTLKGHLAADSLERVCLLFDALANEVRKHDDKLRHLPGEETLRGLVLDAVRKAANT